MLQDQTLHNTTHTSVLVFPITIAEIEKVLPRVYQSTFNPAYRPTALKSTISVKLSTKKKWFDLHTTGDTFEMGEIAAKVFKERFSEETYYRFEEMYFASDSSDDDISAKAEEGVAVEADDVADGITDTLGRVLLGEEAPDDWEDLASDSE